MTPNSCQSTFLFVNINQLFIITPDNKNIFSFKLNYDCPNILPDLCQFHLSTYLYLLTQKR